MSSSILGLITAVTVIFGPFAKPLAFDECPRVTLSCARTSSQGAEYKCIAVANQASDEDAPQYWWQLSCGKIIGDSKGHRITIDSSCLGADTLTVTLKVKWPKSPPICEATEEARIKLR